jgi:hypothetical protein
MDHQFANKQVQRQGVSTWPNDQKFPGLYLLHIRKNMSIFIINFRYIIRRNMHLKIYKKKLKQMFATIIQSVRIELN